MPLIEMINNSYSNKSARHNVLSYIIRNAFIYGGLAVDPDYAEFQMQLVKELFYKSDPHSYSFWNQGAASPCRISSS